MLLALACDRPAPVAAAPSTTAFNHEVVFPLSTGEHHKNIDCAACHGPFDTFTKFDCLGCHARGETDSAHADEGVKDYVYESAACYRCHPTGECRSGGHTEDCPGMDGMMAGSTTGDPSMAGSTTGGMMKCTPLLDPGTIATTP